MKIVNILLILAVVMASLEARRVVNKEEVDKEAKDPLFLPFPLPPLPPLPTLPPLPLPKCLPRATLCIHGLECFCH